MATVNMQAARPVKTASQNPLAKRFHGRLKVDADLLSDRRRRSLLDRRLGSPQRADQRRERRADLRADQLRSAVVLEPVGHERHLQQVLLRRGRHARARKQRQAARPPRLPHDRRLGPRRRLLRHAQPTASDSTASWPGSACISTARSIRPSGSTSACTTSTASRARSAIGIGTRKTRESIQPENPYEYPARPRRASSSSVDDNMEDIMELARSEAMLFKFGSGTGTDLSTLRSHREKLSGGGKPSRARSRSCASTTRSRRW